MPSVNILLHIAVEVLLLLALASLALCCSYWLSGLFDSRAPHLIILILMPRATTPNGNANPMQRRALKGSWRRMKETGPMRQHLSTDFGTR